MLIRQRESHSYYRESVTYTITSCYAPPTVYTGYKRLSTRRKNEHVHF